MNVGSDTAHDACPGHREGPTPGLSVCLPGAAAYDRPVSDPTGVPVAVRRATAADVPALVSVLARAFSRDPMVTWPLVTDEDLVPRIRAMFEAVDTPFAAAGWMYEAGDGVGAMTLLPPDSEARQAELEAAASAAIAGLAPDAGQRYELMWSWIAETLPAGRHWLLDQLAVEPAAQGRGIGGTMLRFAIERARADGLPLYLETGMASNVAWYERFGFRVALQGDAPGGGPHIWFMRRDQAPADHRAARR